MKIPTLLFLSFFLFTFSSNLLLSSGQRTPAAVLDTSGNQLRRGVQYNIFPAEPGFGGAVEATNDRGARCPIQITLSPAEGGNGSPTEFSPINPMDTVIRLSTDLNIKFTSVPATCPESTVWMLNNGSQSSLPPFLVTVNGVEGNPRPETVSSWFKIERDGDAYQIRFCPSSRFCPPGVLCRFLCGNIGATEPRPLRRLAYVDQQPFRVKFTRV